MEISTLEDELEEGQELETYCPKCKAETTHTFLGDDDDEVKRARCSQCDLAHVFKRTVEEETVEVKKKPSKSKPTYEQIIGKKKSVTYRPYNATDIFLEMEIIQHPIFGLGFVSEMIGSDKIEVTFEKDKRVLIHNKLRRPIPIEQLSTYTEKKKSAQLPEDAIINLDELLNLPEDIGAMLADEESDPFGNKPSKLSAKAWAALNEEEEEEVERADDDDEEPGASLKDKKKEKPSSEKGKKSTKPSKTASSAQKGKQTKLPSGPIKKKSPAVPPQNKKKTAATQPVSRSL